MKNITTLLLSIAVLAINACATGPQRPAQLHGDDYAYARDHMRWMIHETMQDNDIVGLSIALVDDQRIVWAEGFGYADKKNKVEATPETIYRTGSITKLFTATAAMQLVDEGKLDIELPLQHYLPAFAIKSRFSSANPITPRNLMTHHSGLPSDRYNRMWGDESANFTELAALLNDEYVANPPNVIGAYSNLGFALLGHAVAEVSGMSYADFVEQRILRPSGMQQAYVAPTLLADDHSSKAYFRQKERAAPYLRDLPAGALNSSVVDLARFAQMTFANGRSNGRQILQPETLEQMQQYQDGDATFDVNRAVGLAWRLDNRFGDEAGVLASHNGGTGMFFSEFLTLPKQKLAVVVLANSNTAAGVVGKIAEEALALALESKTGIKAIKPAELKAKLPTLVEDLERLPGSWSTSMGLVQIHRSGNDLKFDIRGTKLDMVRREDDHYHLQYKVLGLLPISMGEMGKAGVSYQKIAGRELLTLYVNGQPVEVVAEKVSPQPLPASWEKHLGRYESINSIGAVDLKNVELRYVDGLLRAKYTAKYFTSDENFAEALMPVTDNEAVIQGLGRSKGDTVQFVEVDGEMLMSYSGFLLRRIR